MNQLNSITMLALIAIISLFFSFFLMWLHRRQTARVADIKNGGITVPGEIIRRRTGYIPRFGQRSRYVTYTYEYRERTYIRKQRVAVPAFQLIGVGDSVRVICLPEDPAIARLADIDSYDTIAVAIGYFIGMAIIFGIPSIVIVFLSIFLGRFAW